MHQKEVKRFLIKKKRTPRVAPFLLSRIPTVLLCITFSTVWGTNIEPKVSQPLKEFNCQALADLGGL
jgi:hypothetical protein